MVLKTITSFKSRRVEIFLQESILIAFDFIWKVLLPLDLPLLYHMEMLLTTPDCTIFESDLKEIPYHYNYLYIKNI